MQKRPKKIFFSGIGGSGVSALACFVKDQGKDVRGSDRAFDINTEHPLYKLLRAKGIEIFPHDGSGIDRDVEHVVFSTAVEKNHPDLVKAHHLGIPLISRPDFLAQLVSSYKTIAVAGTNGKSTTSGMLAYVMDGLSMHPGFIGGGRVKQFHNPVCPGNALYGTSDLMVIEACEADGTIVNYHPAYSIITSLSFDHHSVEETAHMFHALLHHTDKLVITNSDDKNLNQHAIEGHIQFSIDNESDYKAESITYRPMSTYFTVQDTEFTINLPGKHNLYNALSCISILSQLGVPLRSIASVLPDFSGIERRFDVHLNDRKGIVIDDYAHNPSKIAALMETVKEISSSVCYIFQPHGFSPTRLMKDGYVNTFITHLRQKDHLILLPIFYQGGTVAQDISSDTLAHEIQSAGRSVEVLNDRASVFTRIEQWKCFVVFGARDESLNILAQTIAEKLKNQNGYY
jgi:UDP-N-acetylmuramate--alanine ligase